MNKDIFVGKGKEMRGQLKEWWGELTDDELKQTNGNAGKIVGLLQQKYGYTRDAAEKEFNRRIENVADRLPDDFRKKLAQYPWVAITMSLAAGLLLVVILKKGRQLIG